MSRSIFSTIASLFAASDEQAMWRVQMQDDAEAFAELMRRWERPIQNLCTRMTGDRHRGEDLAQEAFLRIYTRRKDYEPSSKFSTYLWRVALNVCYDELRRLKRRRESPLDQVDSLDAMDELPDGSPASSTRIEAEERAAEVRAALQQLAEPYRAVVVMRHYEDLKFLEIAEVLAIPEGTVKSRMAEAMTQLSKILRTAAIAENKSNERLLL